MTVELDVPAGTRLHLRADQWRPNPTGRDEVVWTVAVYPHVIGGMVWVRGHTCCDGPEPDCGSGWCYEAQVSVDAIRANLDGDR